jgi:hypothetical protein
MFRVGSYPSALARREIHWCQHRVDSAVAGSTLRYFLASDWEVVFGWNTAEFSLFAVFSPFVTKLAAINSCNRLVRWLKKEEDSLFINAVLSP